MAVCPKNAWTWVRALLHSVYEQPDAASVHAQFDHVLTALADKLPKVAAHLEAARADVLAFTAFPKETWRQIWSNNPSERLNREIRRRTDGVVCSRGRVWLASQHDRAVWLESAGQGLRVGDAGPWLATLDDEAWIDVDAHRRVAAALRWDPVHGDRHTELVVLTHRQRSEEHTSELQSRQYLVCRLLLEKNRR